MTDVSDGGSTTGRPNSIKVSTAGSHICYLTDSETAQARGRPPSPPLFPSVWGSESSSLFPLFLSSCGAAGAGWGNGGGRAGAAAALSCGVGGTGGAAGRGRGAAEAGAARSGPGTSGSSSRQTWVRGREAPASAAPRSLARPLCQLPPLSAQRRHSAGSARSIPRLFTFLARKGARAIRSGRSREEAQPLQPSSAASAASGPVLCQALHFPRSCLGTPRAAPCR